MSAGGDDFRCSRPALATTLLDYPLPSATEIPDIRVSHMETPSPYTEFGTKGIGEGGAVGPPAAIVCAVNDALRAAAPKCMIFPSRPRASSLQLGQVRDRQGGLTEVKSGLYQEHLRLFPVCRD